VEDGAKDFLDEWITRMEDVWQGRQLLQPFEYAIVMAALTRFRGELISLHIGTTGLV